MSLFARFKFLCRKRQLEGHTSLYSTFKGSIVNSKLNSPICHGHSFSVKRKNFTSRIYTTLFGFRKANGNDYSLSKRHSVLNAIVERPKVDSCFGSPVDKYHTPAFMLKENITHGISGLLSSRSPANVTGPISLSAINTVKRMLLGGSWRNVFAKGFVRVPPGVDRNRIILASTVDMPILEARISASTNHCCPNISKGISLFKSYFSIFLTCPAMISQWIAGWMINIIRCKFMSFSAMSSLFGHMEHYSASRKGLIPCR